MKEKRKGMSTGWKTSFCKRMEEADRDEECVRECAGWKSVCKRMEEDRRWKRMEETESMRVCRMENNV